MRRRDSREAFSAAARRAGPAAATLIWGKESAKTGILHTMRELASMSLVVVELRGSTHILANTPSPVSVPYVQKSSNANDRTEACLRRTS
jgi:hypothetical protein